MHFNGRSIMTFLVVVLSFIPGAYGSISIGGGTSVAVSGESSVEGNLATNGLNTQASVSSTGIIDNLNMQHWVTNTIGDHVDVGVSATKAAGFSYDYATSSGEGNVGSSNAVWAEQQLSASSVDSLQTHAFASNSVGYQAGANLALSHGSLNSYHSSAYAGPALWLGIDKGAFVQQVANNANGDYILAMTWGANPAQGAAGISTAVTNGALNEYSVQANAVKYSNGPKATGVSLDSISASAPSGSIIQVTNTYDNKGDWSMGNTSVTNGNLAGNSWAYSVNQWAYSESNQNINAEGSVIDVGAYAQNNKPGYEYLSYVDGTGTVQSVPITAPNGAAKFEFKNYGELTTNVNSRATSDNVLITPTLPMGTKTAIMLEPMNYAFDSTGATDLRSTVFPTLVGKGYAVLSYDDAGASIDKFQNLGQYNVVLVDSHMNSSRISLSSTTGGLLDSYTTSKNSLVILAGCDSFDGYPVTKSALANWVSGADLSGGYTGSVNIKWNNDYLSYFFDELSNGNTASSANSIANTLATKKYGYNQYYLPLVFYGDQTFKLLL